MTTKRAQRGWDSRGRVGGHRSRVRVLRVVSPPESRRAQQPPTRRARKTAETRQGPCLGTGNRQALSGLNQGVSRSRQGLAIASKASRTSAQPGNAMTVPPFEGKSVWCRGRPSGARGRRTPFGLKQGPRVSQRGPAEAPRPWPTPSRADKGTPGTGEVLLAPRADRVPLKAGRGTPGPNAAQVAPRVASLSQKDRAVPGHEQRSGAGSRQALSGLNQGPCVFQRPCPVVSW